MAEGHSPLDFCSPAMTSPNGIWPEECLGCVRAGVRASASKFLKAQPLLHCVTQTFLQDTTHLFQWIYCTDSLAGSVEAEGRGKEGRKYVLLEDIVDGGVGGDKGGRE